MIGEWTLRVRDGLGDKPWPVLVMLHGWTGNENVMWVFAPRLPRRFLILAPRGIYPSPLGGYAWHSHAAGAWPAIEDFLPAVNALLGLLNARNFPGGEFSQVHLAGFSQGTALAYAFTLLHPTRVASLAALAGFMPERAGEWIAGQPLAGLPVFVSHGRFDELVPVERARNAVTLLDRAGADVSYCEEDVGHKLAADCFRGLGAFFDK